MLSPKEMGYLMEYFTTPFRQYDLPNIIFQMKLKRKSYQEINVVLPDNMEEKND